MNDVPVPPDVLLHYDSVRTTRDRRAREYPGRHGPRDQCRRLLPGGHSRNHPQFPRTVPRQDRCRDRITIHRRIVEGWCHGTGPDRLGENAASGTVERDGLSSADWHCMRCNPSKGLVDADQRMEHVLAVTAAAR